MCKLQPAVLPVGPSGDPNNKPFAVIGAGSWSNQQQRIIVLLFGLENFCSAFVLYIYICSLLGLKFGLKEHEIPQQRQAGGS